MENTPQAKRTCIRHSWELAALIDLARGILNDEEYRDYMSDKEWKNLHKAIDNICVARQYANGSFCSLVILTGPDVFYGHSDYPDKMVDEFRNKLAMAAAEECDWYVSLTHGPIIERPIFKGFENVGNSDAAKKHEESKTT